MVPWATLETIGDKAVLRFERRLAHPPEKVFRAISDGAELAHWFPARVQVQELRAGAPIRFEFPDADVDAPAGEVLQVDPPKLLVYMWGDDVLRWEIVPEEPDSGLHFTHTVTGADDWPARLQAARHAAGWDVCLAALVARLDRREPGEVDWFARNQAYVERFGLADGELREQTGGSEVRVARDLVQPRSAVWSALAGGAEPTEGDEPPPGFTAGDFEAGAVTAVQAGRLLEYDCENYDASAVRVRWELRELRLRHGPRRDEMLRAAPAELAPPALAAWEQHVQRLVATLHGVSA